ncbi:MAG TPA: GYF domain-containing protein [Candidatus Acidoferrum sp.]|jgi:hypothetical protein
MNYFVKRDIQEYGPYTLSELQRYTATGNVLLTDLCRSEGMTDWVPVSQVIGNIPVPAPGATTAVAGSIPAMSLYPAPPSLHWGVVVLLGIITCGVFGWVWALVESSWMKKVAPASKAMMLYGIAIGLILCGTVYRFYEASQGMGRSGLESLFNLAGGILWIVASFSFKASIEEHFSTVDPMPSAMNLSGVMTFFFSIYYFQFHFTKVNEAKRRQGIYV